LVGEASSPFNYLTGGKMAWKVLEVVGLPQHEEREVHPGITVPVPNGQITRKEPGESITKDEMQKHGQTDEDIARLVKSKAIEEDK